MALYQIIPETELDVILKLDAKSFDKRYALVYNFYIRNLFQ